MDHANEDRGPLRRKTPAWLVSLGIHAGFALLFGTFWVVRKTQEEKVVVVRPPTPRAVLEPIQVPLQRADNHPPIVPKEFQPDPVIVNDAFRVVENTFPENKQYHDAPGESLAFMSDRPLNAILVTDSIGGAGGTGGRYGLPGRARFG